MLEHINYDSIFNWKLWAILKWVLGAMFILFFIASLWLNAIYKDHIKEIEKERDWDITVLNKILFDTKESDETLIKMIQAYLRKKSNDSL